ncbi:sortase [Paenibacillus sp.]|uniref:sortase n=1 Tax=Paenibacillus sp. TaxID=58172 RepID=UPI002D39B397|nr:sortase [Paenibacillus sp.]HZG83806.1 sortase [Paenibacillus sp.]
MVNVAEKQRWTWGRLFSIVIPAVMIVGGAALFSYHGWSYMKQTVLLRFFPAIEYVPGQNGLWSPEPKIGEKIGDLHIPSLNVDVPIIHGTEARELERGAGHYPESSLPGQGGHVYVAGHRDTVFIKLKDLKIGDTIEFATPYGTYIYEATGFQIVPDTDTSVLAATDFETLTLQTCYPFGFIGPAPDRYIVQTKFIGIALTEPTTRF